MAIDSQIPHESGVNGRVKCTPLQGTEYAKRCASLPPPSGYRNLEEWFEDVSTGHHFYLTKADIIPFARVRPSLR